MKTTGKKIVTTAAVVFAAGIVLTIIGVLIGGWPGLKITRSGISPINEVAQPYELTKTKIDKFTKADITLDYADIDIQISQDNQYYVEYLLDGNSGEPLYGVSNDTFRFRQKDSFGGFTVFQFIDRSHVISPYMRLYIPENAKLSSLALNSESGDIELNGVKSDSAKINSEYGACNIDDSAFDELTLSVESTDLEMENSTATGFSFTGSYGELNLTNFSSDSVRMNLESYDASIDATKLGTLDYNNQYGELELVLPEKMDLYSFNISVEYGDIDLPDSAPIGHYSDSDDSEKTYRFEGSTDNKITITSESGDVDIR